MDIKNLVLELCNCVCIGSITEAFDIAEKYLKNFSEVSYGNGYLRADIIKNKNNRGKGCESNCKNNQENNLESKANTGEAIMLEAHIDEVGMVITKVFDDGFLLASPVGSLDGRILPSMPVKIFGKETVYGVFTSIPPHLTNEDACPGFDNCFIDTGDPDIKEKVCEGDFAVFDINAKTLLNDRITGRALDNRAGVAAVISAAEKIAADEKIKKNITVMLTTGEELGLRGARTATFSADAVQSISVDVSFADCPGIPEHKTAKLSSGAMIGISPVLDKEIYQKLKATAAKWDIPFTVEVMGGNTSTNADVISVSKSGIKTGLISIPLRNMHTPCEVVSCGDISAVCELIYRYVTDGDQND